MASFEHSPRHGQRGLAYIWVLLTVALLGLGLTAAEEMASTVTRRSQETELLAVGRQFRQALQRYYEAPVAGTVLQHYPTSLEDLLADKRSGVLHRHLRKIFVDPMIRQARWGLVIVNQQIIGVYSLSEATPIKQDGFEAEEALFRARKRYREWVFTYPANALDGLASSTVDFSESGRLR